MLMQQRLVLKLAQKPVLTQSLRQLVKLLALNKLELKEEISQELLENPVLEAAVDGDSEAEPGASEDEEAAWGAEAAATAATKTTDGAAVNGSAEAAPAAAAQTDAAAAEDAGAGEKEAPDAFDEIDIEAYFNDYLDPGIHTPFAVEALERPSFETFLAQPSTLTDHLLWQLSLSVGTGRIAETVEAIIGNLDEDGYLTATLEEVAALTGASEAESQKALKVVQEFDPLGVGSRNLEECLTIQLRECGAGQGVAGAIVAEHFDALERGDVDELSKRLARPRKHVEVALQLIKHLDPRPGQQYNVSKVRTVEPDVFFVKSQDGFRVVLNEDDLPDLRLNRQYRQLLRKGRSTKETRDYVKDRYNAAIQLLRNIQQRRHTIEGVCEAVVRRQTAFLANGLDHLRPMMIKDVAEEIGVHASTVSRAVANKYAHTPHGVYELRFFFSEAVKGPSGASVPLLLLKRRVKKMIEEENPAAPLTDEHLSKMLREQGISVTRRTVAKYREDMNIPSTHRRRRRAG